MRIKIDAENVTNGPDDPTHVQRDMAAAAAEIKHAVAALESRVFEEPQACLAHDVGKQVEPALSVLAAGDRVECGAAPLQLAKFPSADDSLGEPPLEARRS